jgi:hypothetical protein
MPIASTRVRALSPSPITRGQSISDRPAKGVRMPVRNARTRGKHFVRHIGRLDRESYETLYTDAAFIGEPPEYVLNQLIDTMLAKDTEFHVSTGHG